MFVFNILAVLTVPFQSLSFLGLPKSDPGSKHGCIFIPTDENEGYPTRLRALGKRTFFKVRTTPSAANASGRRGSKGVDRVCR